MTLLTPLNINSDFFIIEVMTGEREGEGSFRVLLVDRRVSGRKVVIFLWL